MRSDGSGPRHGEHRTGADICLNDWHATVLEPDEFFPRLLTGLFTPEGALKASRTDETSPDRKTPVFSRGQQGFVWRFTMPHKTRRWNYFITRPDWNPLLPLTRTQLGVDPLK